MKNFTDKLLLIFLIAVLMAIPVKAQTQEEIYLQQEQGNTCTLAASTMMLRSCLYQAGSDDWENVTESDVGRRAWSSEGLYWNWDYEIEDHSFSVAHKGLSGISSEELENILQDHPEGIVLYCGNGAPHAVFLTDYADGVFYCADSANSYAGKRMPLDESLLGDRWGSQNDILAAATAYWYIVESEIELPAPNSVAVTLPKFHRIIQKNPVFFSEKY